MKSKYISFSISRTLIINCKNTDSSVSESEGFQLITIYHGLLIYNYKLIEDIDMIICNKCFEKWSIPLFHTLIQN